MITTVRVQFDKLMGETPKACLLKIEGRECWFPRKLCRKFVLNKKLGGNMVIPAWLFKEKFGYDPDESIAETIVKHHVPEKITPLQSNSLKELKK